MGKGYNACQHQGDQRQDPWAALLVAPGGIVAEVESLMQIVRGGDDREQQHGDAQECSQPEQAPTRDTKDVSPGQEYDRGDRQQPYEIEQLFQGR